jgi:glycosyltransferase involved in cell wall biosynthesis/predicted  nucleic acid-binding Zn-ribbon protein
MALRREERDGYAINWLTTNQAPETPRQALILPEVTRAFAAFLERERPEVVHFQHLLKLGLGLVEAARERGIPCVYTAHDYFAVCHRYTLLRPDLTHCDVRGDARACARCDLALSHLNQQPDLGDYQMGALAEQLAPSARARLAGILADRLGEHGVAPEEFEQLHSERRELDRLRAEAFARFDLVLAPSRYLLAELERGGLARERLAHQEYGFACADLAAVPARPRVQGSVRFAFLGGLSKHKGVHVLLEAFSRVPRGAELAVWGHSSDKPYVDFLRARCGAVGAQWRGPYERADLPRILAEVDALVVPSIWVENWPLVIREAFAARRPVLASRLGALSECVRDGEDGLLFTPGDPDDLARVLRRCVEEPALLPALAARIGPVRTIEADAAALVARYEPLVARARASAARAELPASLKAPLARYEELSALPARELFMGVLSGLDDLREAWAGELGTSDALELLALGLGEGSEAQDRLREARNEIAWLRTKKEELDEGREELMTLFEDLDRLLNETRTSATQKGEHLESAGQYVRQKEAELAEAHARLRALEAQLAAKDSHIQSVEGQLQEAGRYIRHKEQEYRDVEAELGKAAEHVRAKERELSVARDQFGAAESVLKAAREGALEAKSGAELGTRQVASVGLTALETQARLLNRFLRPILEGLHRIQDPNGELVLPAEGAPFSELLLALRQVLTALGSIERELEWRRPMEAELEWRKGRMAKVAGLARSPWLVLAPVWLARESGRWKQGPPAGGGAQ